MPSRRSGIHATGIEAVDGHRISQVDHLPFRLGKDIRERLALLAPALTAIDAQLALGRKVLRVALDRYCVDPLGLMGMDRDRKANVAGQIDEM